MTILKGDRMLAWEGKADDGYRARLFLIRGEPRGEVELFRGDTLLLTEPLGVKEIAMFAAHRDDLIDVWMDEMIVRARVH